jgi:hypothetical protein
MELEALSGIKTKSTPACCKFTARALVSSRTCEIQRFSRPFASSVATFFVPLLLFATLQRSVYD